MGPRGQLVDGVVDRIQQLIIARSLKPGDLLPPEEELALQMSVSRTALREAKRILADRGLIEVRQGFGTIVTEVGEDQLADQLRLYAATRFGGIDFEDFHRMRSLLETEIAGRAAEARNDEDLEVLASIMAEMRSAGSADPVTFTHQDVAFHEKLGAMSGNPLLALLSMVIRDLLKTHISQVVTFITPEVDVLPFHQAILDAVVAGDSDAASEAMTAHLMQARNNYETSLAAE